MILSVSRRTDIPAFYMDWLEKRFREGFVLVRNPLNYHRVSRVPINPGVIDCIVFWTKDPSKFTKRIDTFKDYHYYFQISITPYSNVFERSVPATSDAIKSFINLSKMIGKKRVIWRYDPIMLTSEVDITAHISYFESMADKLAGFTDKCIISFIDIYPGKRGRMSSLGIREPDEAQMHEIGRDFSRIAASHGLRLETCCEKVDLSDYSIGHGKCIDDVLISELVGDKLMIPADKNQRQGCGCAKSIDIGAYNSCPHDCVYCYANYSNTILKNNLSNHRSDSPLLIGDIGENDFLTERKMESYRKMQLEFDV